MHHINVVIADADRIRRVECRRLLRQGRHLRLVAQATRREDVFPMVTRYRPRVLVLALELYGEECGDLLAALHASCPDTMVVLLPTRARKEDQVLRALLNGARAYLTHETLRQQFCNALHGVDDGEAWVPRKMLGKVLDRLDN